MNDPRNIGDEVGESPLLKSDNPAMVNSPMSNSAGWKEVLLGAKNWNLAMVLIGLLPLIIYLLALPYMPDQIPAHYNIHGQLDRWSNKYEGLFLGVMSLLMCAVWLVCEIPVGRSARKLSNSDMNPQTTVRVWAMGGCCMFVVFNVINLWMISDAFGKGRAGYVVPLEPILNVVTGLVFIVLGNIMPNAKPNGWSGIRVPGAYKSRESWRRCQRFGGFAFIVGGVVLVIGGLAVRSPRFVNLYAILVVCLAMVVTCCIYGIYAGKKYGEIGGSINRE
ncbi:Uncharacterized membrane protein [Bifidobacterium bohemicum]|uniref:Putative membrane protein n=1 Tax=Bifidobacterium bohemicum DSM 22767 TaxID=1437606 RepID=A0A086ZJK8_9BIFI|nr:SdpI family protein [Bifidobacterium bohemicum]KFI46708.1 putative membrane protein [Bifidobacterium bohemicum DSM 22767]SCB79443.1 Uncharacterized membrane protein [Bifidobacterium bohemicum]